MSSDFDATEFVDSDLQAARKSGYVTPAGPGQSGRAPTREEVESRVSEMQQKLVELKRSQDELERERATLEETRRRQVEFQTGREEMVQHLTRGIGLLEEAEFNSRRDAEQMARSLDDLRDALGKVQEPKEESWTAETFNVELTRALTTVENARMEWNGARLKFPVLSNSPKDIAEPATANASPAASLFSGRTFFDLCKLGLALTWPLAVVALASLVIFLVILLQR